jgi:hypothetical protein
MIILYDSLDAKFIGDSLGHFQADIAYRDQVCFRNEPGNVATMHAAHPSSADHREYYFSGHLMVSPM